MNTTTISTDKYGFPYHGPRTFRDACERIDLGDRNPALVVDAMKDAGYVRVAARVARAYGITDDSPRCSAYVLAGDSLPLLGDPVATARGYGIVAGQTPTGLLVRVDGIEIECYVVRIDT